MNKPNRREFVAGALVLAGCGAGVVNDAGPEVEGAPNVDSGEQYYGQGDTLPGEDEMSNSLDDAADPVILFTTCVVEAGGNGSPDVAKLTNPDHLPMEILEIRFRIYPTDTSVGSYSAITGMAIGVKMDLGSIPVVDADFPISLFGSVRDSYEFGQSELTPSRAIPMTFAWRLAHPLYVPAGATLAPSFTHLGQSAFPVNVDVVYIARLATGAKPAVVRVPWVTKYTSKSFDISQAAPADKDSSNSLDIANPFSVPLFLSRLVGRVSIFQNEATSSSVGRSDNVVYEDPMQFRNRLAKMTVRSSRGADIIRTPTAIGTVFPANWRAWETPGEWQIQPGEFYNVKLTSVVVPDVFATSAYVSRAQVSVGLVGYREVPRNMVGVP